MSESIQFSRARKLQLAHRTPEALFRLVALEAVISELQRALTHSVKKHIVRAPSRFIDITLAGSSSGSVF